MYRVLLLSGTNSLLSPAAEGYFRLFSQNREVYGAGVEISGPDADMMKVLKEDGVDINRLRSYSLSDLRHIDFDYVLTFDEESEKASHHLPSKAVKYHFHFDKYLEADTGESKEELYLNIRNQVKKIIRSFIKEHFPDG
jgi:protein-tyrosine-phosphatase